MHSVKVLLLTETFSPAMGGVETFLQNLCTFSRAEFTVLTAGPRELLDTSAGYHIERCVPRPRVGLASYLAHAASICKRAKYDAVFLGYFSPVVWVGLLVRAIFATRLVALVHGRDLEFFLASGAWSRSWYTWALRRCDFIWSNCRYNRDRYSALGLPPEKTGVLNPGVDVSFFRPRPAARAIIERYGLSERRVLLTVGRLVEKKNHALVIRALRALLPRFPDLVYLIVGEGPEHGRLAALARDLGVETRVVFAGAQQGEALVDLYNACNVFVMPSAEVRFSSPGTGRWGNDAETFGIAFLEAGACGRPVVGGRSGGVADAVADGETGYLVDPGSVDQLQAAVASLLEDPSKAGRMGEQGRERAIKEFAWEKVAARFDVRLEALVEFRA